MFYFTIYTSFFIFSLGYAKEIFLTRLKRQLIGMGIAPFMNTGVPIAPPMGLPALGTGFPHSGIAFNGMAVPSFGLYGNPFGGSFDPNFILGLQYGYPNLYSPVGYPIRVGPLQSSGGFPMMPYPNFILLSYRKSV